MMGGGVLHVVLVLVSIEAKIMDNISITLKVRKQGKMWTHNCKVADWNWGFE